MINPLLARMARDTGEQPVLGSGYFVRNPKYGKAVSDQYRALMITTTTGRTLTGLVVSRDAEKLAIATNLRRPHRTTVVNTDNIADETPIPVSTMPTELLNVLSEDEVLDLVAYLISGGEDRHPVSAD